MKASTMAVPMSGCLSTSRPDTASRPRSGTTAAIGFSRRSARRARRSAAKTAMASFMSSEGWMRRGPTPIHRLEPPAKIADAGHEHRHEEPQGQQRQHDPQRGASGRSGCGPWRRRR